MTLQLGGKSVVIEAPGVHAGQARQATATWQGQPLTAAPPQGGQLGRWLPHALVTQGGVLRFFGEIIRGSARAGQSIGQGVFRPPAEGVIC